MRKYESVIVFRPDLAEDRVKQELKRFQDILQSKGAEEVKVDTWGKREIAYPVRKYKQGRFVSLDYQTNDYSAVSALTSILRISEDVIKFQSHKVKEKVRKFKGNPRRAVNIDVDDDYSDIMETEY